MKLYFHGTEMRKETRKEMKKSYKDLPAVSLEYEKGKYFMLDAGSFDFDKFDLDNMEAVFFSHLHPDHVSAFPYILLEFIKDYGRNPEKKKTLSVFAPEERDMWNNPPYWLPPKTLKNFTYEISAKIPGRFRNISIDSIKAEHAVLENGKKIPANCYKFSKDNETVSYTGDTMYFPELSEFFKGSDVLICEASLSNEQEWLVKSSGHMIPKSIIKLADEVRPKLLVLTHFSEQPGEEVLKEVEKEYKGKVKQAYTGKELDITKYLKEHLF